MATEHDYVFNGTGNASLRAGYGIVELAEQTRVAAIARHLPPVPERLFHAEANLSAPSLGKPRTHAETANEVIGNADANGATGHGGAALNAVGRHAIAAGTLTRNALWPLLTKSEMGGFAGGAHRHWHRAEADAQGL